MKHKLGEKKKEQTYILQQVKDILFVTLLEISIFSNYRVSVSFGLVFRSFTFRFGWVRNDYFVKV